MNDEKMFLDNINKKLDKETVDLNESTQSALFNIRQQALKQTTKPSLFGLAWLQPTPIMFTAGIVLVVSVLLNTTLLDEQLITPSLDDIGLLTANEGIAFYDDLEFYQWIEAEKING